MIHLDEEESLFLRLIESSGVFRCLDFNKVEALESLIKDNKGLLIFSNQIDSETILKLKKSISELSQIGFNLSGKMIAFKMESDNYLTGNELECLIEIEQYLEENNAQLVIEAEDLFTLDEILITNDKLQSEVDYINSLTIPTENNRPLNQFEKFIMAYDFCTNFKYNEHESNSSKSRYITSILNGNNIVCVGYAKLLNEMCSRLGIECYSVGVTCIDSKTQKKDGHQNNIVVLDGKLYYADACWDCQRDACKGLKLYNHCLIPLSDRNHVVDCEINYSDYNILPHTKEYLIKAKEFLVTIKTGSYNDDECESFLTMFFNIVGHIMLDYDLVKEDGLSYDELYNEAQRIKLMRQLKILIDYLNVHQEGKAISLDCFEDALYNIYIAKGMSVKAAKSLLERTIKLNTDRAKTCFSSNAENCFIAGKTKEVSL